LKDSIVFLEDFIEISWADHKLSALMQRNRAQKTSHHDSKHGL